MGDGERRRLHRYGWTGWHAGHYRELLETDPSLDPAVCAPARARSVIRHLAHLVVEDGEATAFVPGKMRATEPPAVGDWVVLERRQGVDPVVCAVLPRRGKLSRKVAGQRSEEQVLAANVDTVFLVMGLDGDFNLRRLERLTVVARQSGGEPVVVLTKRDLVDAEVLETRRAEVERVSPGVAVFAVSAKTGEGLEPLEDHLVEGRTVVLLGSSGVGKSTLLNTLVGEEVMRTAKVREGDDRGRHTTSHRELVPLPGGGLLIDGPGIREVQLWVESEADEEVALGEAFADVEELAGECRFRDCTHRHEPGCAVRSAVEAGELEARRLANYHALQEEMEALERRKDAVAQRRFEKKRGAFYKKVLAANTKRKGRGEE